MANPEELFIDQVLRFRAAVLEQFNRPVGAAPDPQEIEETESEELVLLA